MYYIDEEQNISYLTEGRSAPEGAPVFENLTDFRKVTQNLSLKQLTDLWNSFAGVAPFGDLKPVKIFKDGQGEVVKRIWTAVQRLDPAHQNGNGSADVSEPESEEAETAEASALPNPAPKKPREKKPPKPKLVKPKKERKPKAEKKPKAPKPPKEKKPRKPREKQEGFREGSKGAKVIDMLKRAKGATIKDVMDETGWLPHTSRAFISVACRKLGLKVEHERKKDGGTYRIVE